MRLTAALGLLLHAAPAWAQDEEEGSLEDYVEGSEEEAPSGEEEPAEEEGPPAEEEPEAEETPVEDVLEEQVKEPEGQEPEPAPLVDPAGEGEPVEEVEEALEPEEEAGEPEPHEESGEPASAARTTPPEERRRLASLRPPELRPWQGFTTSLLLELGGMGTAFSIAWWWSERGDSLLYNERLAWVVLVPSLGALGATGGVWLQGGRFGGRTGLGAVMGVGASVVWLGAGLGIGTLMARQDNEYAWIAYVGGSALALISPAAGATVGGLWNDKDGGRKLFGMPLVLPDGQGGAMPGVAFTATWR